MKVKGLSSDAKNRSDERKKKLRDAGFEPVKDKQTREVLGRLLLRGKHNDS